MERRKRGFTSIGKVIISKEKESRKFKPATVFFIKKNNPKQNFPFIKD